MTVSSAHPLHRFPRALLNAALFGALAFTGMACVAPPAQAGVLIGIAVGTPPPPLPYYVQPEIPNAGYVWTPGYWAYDEGGDYYWVPGAWILPPYAGALWTPGYWGWGDNGYFFHRGYWGREVGFYGGINYGYGYGGHGYDGGYWRANHFYYNRSVNNFGGRQITTVYNRPIQVDRGPRVSFNGGHGGVMMQPTQAQRAFAMQPHAGPLAAQVQHENQFRQNPQQRVPVNGGQRPEPSAQTGHPFPQGVPHSQPMRPASNQQPTLPNFGRPQTVPSAMHNEGVERPQGPPAFHGEMRPMEQRPAPAARVATPTAEPRQPLPMNRPPENRMEQAPMRPQPMMNRPMPAQGMHSAPAHPAGHPMPHPEGHDNDHHR
jgi:hypothetical protein